MKCIECFYSVFSKCPVYGSNNNAGCLAIRKSYFDMTKKELVKATEKAYKDELISAARMYNARMAVIKNTFEEDKSDDEEELAH